MVNKFIISEKEKSRISNLHTQKILLEQKFKNSNRNITEQVNYYKDAQGKIVKLEGPMSAPLGTEPATEKEYLAQNPTTTVSQTQQPAPQQLATPQPAPQPAKLTGRWDNASCAGKSDRCKVDGLKYQIKINDLCNPEVLNAVLIKLPKGRVGSVGSFKLNEDGDVGPTTLTAAEACRSSIKLKTSQGQPQTSTPTVSTGGPQPLPVGGNLTANDIKELIS